MLYNKFKIPIVITICILVIIVLILALVSIIKNYTLEKKLANKVYEIKSSSDKDIAYTPVDTTHYSLNTLKNGISVSQANKFFDNSILIGDSVTYMFDKFCNNQLGNLKIYGIVNYGIVISLRPISDNSLHPLYEGNQMQIWNLVKKSKAEKVFLMLGLNDLCTYGVKDSITNYQTLINAINEHNPDVSIYILSITPITKSYKSTLNNNNIRYLNNYLRCNSETLGITYIDIASYLIDDEGYLKDDFSSDNKFHLNSAAYDQWIEVLRSFASYNLY